MPAAFQELAQLPAASVHLVPGRPLWSDPGGQRPFRLREGERRLGGKRVIFRETRRRHPRRIGEPVGLHVQVPVDEGVAPLGRVRRVHRDDHVLDPAHRAGILPTHGRGLRPLLRLPRLVEDQDPAVGAEVPGQERAHHVSRGVLLPADAFEQVVQAIRSVQADCLRDRPAVARNARHQ